MKLQIPTPCSHSLRPLAKRFPGLPAAIVSALLLAGVLCHPLSPACAADPLDLMEAGTENFGWKFDNGQEFPGAKGGISVDQDVVYNTKPTLKLTGDFTDGGAYVRANTRFNANDITEISFWIRNASLSSLTLRLLDTTKQCHQFTLSVNPHDGEWQQVVFKPQSHFAKEGTVEGNKILRYQSWGGAADKEWHGTNGAFDIIIGKPSDGSSKVAEIWIAEVKVTPKD
ncbi:hypothetical protein DB346_11320 [Verrucomicrobia bacterium LW23]|nr:hypothetical protein DB346_11320 [Verrucomicrobia bacterium LW23]